MSWIQSENNQNSQEAARAERYRSKELEIESIRIPSEGQIINKWLREAQLEFKEFRNKER